MAGRRGRKAGLCVAGVLVLLLLVAAAAALLAILSRPRCAPGQYRRAAVAADTRTCSEIGRELLQHGGSATDATIAALICTSALNPQSMGLGGGVIFTIYEASTGKVEVLNARERAPQRTPEDLLTHCNAPFLPGARWIAVPGELRGYEEAHRRYGKLPWKALFKPTIQLLEQGIQVPEVLSKFLNHPLLRPALNRTSVGKLFQNSQGAFLKAGDVLHWPALANTLKAVAENGVKEFYSGALGEALVEDITREGGTLTLEDLSNYRVQVVSPVNISLGNYTAYSAPRPASGSLLFFILNVLEGYNFTKSSMGTLERSAEAYHYIAETLKFANTERAKIEDPRFSSIGEGEIAQLMSNAFARSIREKIGERADSSASHCSSVRLQTAPVGTSHVAVLTEDGSAVSATSTINHPFGSMVYSQRTGIILNNELADFCMKRSKKTISPGEMPPSSMAPTILLSGDGQPKLVIGGSGGSLIIPAIAQAIVNTLWFGKSLDEAIRTPILYASQNCSVKVEKNFSQDIARALRERGHTVQVDSLMLNVVQGASKDGPCIFPYSDQRKDGQASGY